MVPCKTISDGEHSNLQFSREASLPQEYQSGQQPSHTSAAKNHQLQKKIQGCEKQQGYGVNWLWDSLCCLYFILAK